LKAPKETAHLQPGDVPLVGISRLPGEPRAPAVLWLSPAACSLGSASACSSSMMPSSQKHFGWKGPLEGHLQCRAITQVRSAVLLARPGTCRYGFSQGI